MHMQCVQGNPRKSKSADNYIYRIPTDLNWFQHFRSLILAGDPINNALELTLLCSVTLLAGLSADAPGSAPLSCVVQFMWLLSAFRRAYNAYLEAAFCAYPRYRTQKERFFKPHDDVMGRNAEQLRTMNYHDRLTIFTQYSLDVTVYYLIPGFYPQQLTTYSPMYQRLLAFLLNHYLLSFGMYWTHRWMHGSPWLWANIHSLHHWAKRPLSRSTYQDHWFDNFCNAVVGHIFAQILVPLDFQFFWFSRFFRVCESLEKHSGLSSRFNVVHWLQWWLPCAQMPHHHDWHHEGHKGCNYTFTSIGGFWDFLFGTRKSGRASGWTCWDRFGRGTVVQGTYWDRFGIRDTLVEFMNTPWGPLIPLATLSIAVGVKLIA